MTQTTVHVLCTPQQGSQIKPSPALVRTTSVLVLASPGLDYTVVMVFGDFE